MINQKLINVPALLIFVLLFFCPQKNNGQQSRIDSLSLKLRLLENSHNTHFQTRIDLLNNLAQEYRLVKGDSLYKFAYKALHLSLHNGYAQGEYNSLMNIGAFHSDNGDNEKAINYFKNAFKIADSIQDEKSKIFTVNGLGNAYSFLGNYEKALQNFLIGLDLAEESDNKLMQSILNENIAGLYVSQKEYKQALEFYNKVKQLNEEIGDAIFIAETSANLGDLYLEMSNYELAMFNVNRSIGIFEKKQIFDWLAYSYSVKGEIYLKQKKYKWSLYWYEQSMLLHETIEDDRARVDLLNGLASAYFGLEEYEKSNDYAFEAYELSDKIKSLEGKQESAKILYTLHKKDDDFEGALKYHEIFEKISNDLNKAGNQRSLTLLKTKLKHEKDKQLLIANSEKELAKQRNLITIAIITLALLLGAAIPLYIKQKKLKKLYKTLKVNSENLECSQKELNAINGTKDKLFSIIGHDLRGPIGALQGLLKLMDHGEIKKEDFTKFIPRLRADVDHILFTLNNLLSWGYSQMNGTVTKPKAVNFKQLVKDNVNLLTEMAENKSVKIIDQIPENCIVRVDENQIDVVMRNLISNAIKFTPKNGLITLEAHENQEYWKIEVRDTGIGMNEETRKKLFKENANVTTYGTENEKGTGLGLNLCKEMVERNQGKIGVKTAPQKGSTFYFTVPKVTKKYRKAS